MKKYKKIDVLDFLESYPEKKLKYRSPKDLKPFYEKYVLNLNYEQHFLFGLNEKKEIILAVNDTTKAAVRKCWYNRDEDFRLLKESGCTYFITSHNHPSTRKEVRPSDKDIDNARCDRVKAAGNNLVFLDELTVGSGTDKFLYYSYSENKMFDSIIKNPELLERPEYFYRDFNPEDKSYSEIVSEFMEKRKEKNEVFVLGITYVLNEQGVPLCRPKIAVKYADSFNLSQFLKDTEQLGVYKINLLMCTDAENPGLTAEYGKAFKRLHREIKDSKIELTGTMISGKMQLPVFNVKMALHPEEYGLKLLG